MQPIIHVDADFLSYDTIDWIIDWRNKNACNSPFDAKNAGMERMERNNNFHPKQARVASFARRLTTRKKKKKSCKIFHTHESTV